MRSYLLSYYAVMSGIAFCLYAVDKWKARRRKWRIPESLLLSVGVFGGALGALVGMNLFHHKTRHWYFWLVNLFAIVLQVLLLILLK